MEYEGKAMKQWEYKTLYINTVEYVNSDNDEPLNLEQLGRDGWELVQIENSIAFFKRERAAQSFQQSLGRNNG